MHITKDDLINRSLNSLIKWVKDNEYLGWDIYDGLNNEKLFKIKSRIVKIIIIQFNKYSPINFRPILGISKGKDVKGMALFGEAFIHLYSKTNDIAYWIEYNNIVNYVIENSLYKNYNSHCWASHYYPFIGIGGSGLSPSTPDIIGTCHAIITLLESYKISNNIDHLNIAKDSIQFILTNFYVDIDFPYIMYQLESGKTKNFIPNASAKTLEALSLFLTICYDLDIKKVCDRLEKTLLKTQLEDGSWHYSTNLNNMVNSRQLDFHQGYMIDGLLSYYQHSDRKNELKRAIRSASTFYYGKLFKHDGRSLYRYPLPFPIDIHNQSQGIITSVKLRNIFPEFQPHANKICQWTIKNMQDKKGFFYYQKWPLLKNKIPHMRWAQAWMMLALARLKS